MKKIVPFIAVLCFFSFQNFAQVNAGLDNWFNRETNKKTGKSFHYLWNDSAWSGYSEWGKIFTREGASIRLVNEPDAKTLSDLDIYIIADPDTTTENPSPHYILEENAETIEKWVRKGGVLILLANDSGNCEFSHLNGLARRFGMEFKPVSLHRVENKQWETGAFNDLTDHPVFKGVQKIFMKETSSLIISGDVNPVLSEGDNIFIAETKAGKGFVIAITDPWIYNEYIGSERLPEDFENYKAAENLTRYLINKATERKN